MEKSDAHWADSSCGPRIKQPAIYQITVQGWLDENWSEWFDGMAIANEIETDGPPVTIFTGSIADQAALHGLLVKIYNLGLPLLAINCLKSRPANSAGD